MPVQNDIHPSVSVIIPWGKEQGIYRCVESALSQSYRPTRVIVLANGSISPGTVEEFNSRFSQTDLILCKVLTGCRNANIARNFGLLLSDTDLVAFLDSDDWWDEKHLESSIHGLISGPAKLIYSGMRANFKGNQMRVFVAYDYSCAGGMRNYCLSHGAAPTPSLVCYRECALDVMWDWKLTRHQDYDFLARFCDLHVVTYKEDISVNVDWSEKRRAYVTKDCFNVIRQWRGGVSQELYGAHYVFLVKNAILSGDYRFLLKLPKAAFFFARALVFRGIEKIHSML